MNILKSYTAVLVSVLVYQISFGQSDKVNYKSPNFFQFENVKYIKTDSGLIIETFTRLACKNSVSLRTFVPEKDSEFCTPLSKPVLRYISKLFTIHGNISYEYFYRSKTDTPINQQDFQQHTERVYLDILVKEKYPLKVNFSSRQSNSPYFRNFTDANFSFDKYTYNRSLKQQILDKLKAQLPAYKFPDLSKVEAELQKSKEAYAKTKAWLEDQATLQKIIEEREHIYFQKIRAKEDSLKAANPNNIKSTEITGDFNKVHDPQKSLNDSLRSVKSNINKEKEHLLISVKGKADSVTAPFAALYYKKKSQLDSLEQKVSVYTKKADSITKIVQKDVSGIKQKIYKATSEKELRKLAKENGIDLDKRSDLEKQLAAVKTFSLGRSVLNYTELTAQNITVTGVNIEYNPSYYAAFSAGKIDYRFRDFYNKSASPNSQYIVMGRLGVGDKDRKALIFSYFTGRKSTSDYGFSDSVKSHINIIGYSVETVFKKDENTGWSAEFAKSTKPVTGDLQTNKQTGALVKFSDESNMGINIKGQTIIPETNTKLSGFFRKTGENFQSFSLFSYNTDQTAWLARADQSFLKNKITLIGMLRRNDFTNPFTDKTYKTSTVFKSIQLNVRFPKYPAVSVGYYPGTQLYLIDKERIRESAYYILNGSVVYSYFLKGLAMNSSLIYNKYTNQATDSGFVAYKGTNYYASQSVFFKKFQLQGGYSFAVQPELKYYTLETSGNYELKRWLKMGFGLKYSKVNEGDNYWGESIQLRTDFKKLGGFQLQYEKSYLPAIMQTLYPVEIGRVSYYKNF